MSESPPSGPGAPALANTVQKWVKTVAIRNRLAASLTALALAVGVLAAPVLVAAPAQAADNGEWSVFPKTKGGRDTAPREYFFYNVAAGQQLRDSVVISNNTTVPLPLTVYGADAFNTRQGGGFALRPRDEKQTDVGAWVDVARNEVVVPAARRKDGKLTAGTVEVPFTLTVPRNASPGDHVGGLVTIDLRPRVDPNATNNQIAIQRANGVRIYARVNGKLNAQLAVTDVKINDLKPAVLPFLGNEGSAEVEFTVVNNGNTRVNPRARLTMTGLLGRTLHTVDEVTVPEVLPGESITLVERVEGMPPLDQVDARIELTADELAGPVAGDKVAWSVSWVFLGVLLVLLALLVAYGIRKRRQPRRVSADDAPSEPGLEAQV